MYFTYYLHYLHLIIYIIYIYFISFRYKVHNDTIDNLLGKV